MLLEGKRLLVTGVLTPQSIAFDVARVAQEQGAEVVLTGFGRAKSLTDRTARRLPSPPDVLEMDANDEAQIRAVAEELRTRWGRLDGILHAIAYAPEDALGGAFLRTPWESVATAVHTSAYSLKAITVGMGELISEGGSVVSLDFDASQAWPAYDWMGVSQGRAGVGDPLPGRLPGAERGAGELRLGRSAADDGRQGHPGVRPAGRILGRPGPPWDGT